MAVGRLEQMGRDLEVFQRVSRQDAAWLVDSANEAIEVLKAAESCIETPGDLTQEEIRHVLSDIRMLKNKLQMTVNRGVDIQHRI